jgi:hypothetical protein
MFAFLVFSLMGLFLIFAGGRAIVVYEDSARIWAGIMWVSIGMLLIWIVS